VSGGPYRESEWSRNMNGMTQKLPLAWLLVLLASGFLGAGPALAAEDPTSREVAVGRVVGIQVSHGYLTAEFPNGRMNVGMDKRELGWYIVGDEIRIDTFGRPLPRRIVR
jgi:hypothetical protein